MTQPISSPSGTLPPSPRQAPTPLSPQMLPPKDPDKVDMTGQLVRIFEANGKLAVEEFRDIDKSESTYTGHKGTCGPVTAWNHRITKTDQNTPGWGTTDAIKFALVFFFGLLNLMNFNILHFAFRRIEPGVAPQAKTSTVSPQKT